MANYNPELLQTDVGATAVPLTATQTFASCVIIQADDGNNAAVYVGDPTVTTGNGYKLGIPVSNVSPSYLELSAKNGVVLFDLSKIYVVADGASQKVNTIHFSS